MEITPLIQRAITKIGELHRGQPRKAEDFPYVAHPYAVAILLSRYTDDENIIVAGLLHDVLEDAAITVYGPEEMRRDFGDPIYQIVTEVSILETAHRRAVFGLTWLERKQLYLEKLAPASKEALMICAADKIHFLQSIITSYSEYGETLWDKLNPQVTPQQRLWFCQEAMKIIQRRLTNPIVGKLEQTLEQARPILAAKPVAKKATVLPV